MINLSRVFSKYNTQCIKRIVRPQATDCNGYNVIQEYEEEIEAVVTMASASDLNRFTDATTYVKSIKVTTRTPLNPISNAFASDIIIYMGESFIVQGIDSYEAFGYCRAICTLSDYEAKPGA